MEGRIIDRQWRTHLRQYLTAHIGQPLRLGDLYHKFGVTIPTEHAYRIAIQRRCKPDVDIGRARWVTLNLTLHSYTAVRCGKGVETEIWMIGDKCVRCGKQFLARKGLHYCSRSCALTARRAQERIWPVRLRVIEGGKRAA